MKYWSSLLFLTSLLLGFSHSDTLVGTWENSENLIDARPGDIRMVLEKDGTGRLILDKDRYFWIADRFVYQVMGGQIEVMFVYDDGGKTAPGRVDIIRLTQRELIVGYREANLTLSFRKLK